jgi:hypothetical protein
MDGDAEGDHGLAQDGGDGVAPTVSCSAQHVIDRMRLNRVKFP